jgi:pimeloyl-ACP methyl ester carboxylesterase
MPTVSGNGIDIYYEVEGDGEPAVFIPYLAADQACYAFQVAEYAKHFTCFTVDLRGAGRSGQPGGSYTTELLADDIAAFMQAAGGGARSRSRAVAGGSGRHVAGGQVPGPGEVAVTALRVACH